MKYRCENKTPLCAALEDVAISMSPMTADDKLSLFLPQNKSFLIFKSEIV